MFFFFFFQQTTIIKLSFHLYQGHMFQAIRIRSRFSIDGGLRLMMIDHYLVNQTVQTALRASLTILWTSLKAEIHLKNEGKIFERGFQRL